MTTNRTEKSERGVSLVLLALATLNCIIQIAWFWRLRGHNITMDGVNYIGLARHLLDRDFTASLHGYWSPLFSSLIAAGSLFARDFTLVGRWLTIVSFLLCLPLLYFLTFKLWHSHLTASFAVLWFTVARGVIAGAVTTIQADFLLAACTLAYFIRLLACLRGGTKSNWFLLGAVHAIAFLTKAIAMPWLAVATFLAVLASSRQSLKNATTALFLAFLAPAIIWLSWGHALKSKYGVFTTGYQLRANLMTDLKRKLSHHERGDAYAFVDTSYDKYMVADTPWRDLQSFRMMNPSLVPIVLENELHNLPAALKEVVILLTPGGVLALAVGLTLLARQPALHSPEATLVWISLIGLATLVGAYGMLVFDARYVLPITPILMAIASQFIVARGNGQPDRPQAALGLRKAALGLLVLSTLFLTFYWASPFRTVDRDFQMSCYHAAIVLTEAQPTGQTLVSIGDGPYPDNGVGFEAGVYVAYLSGRHLVAMNYAIPDGVEAEQLLAAALHKKADAILVWGKPANSSYATIVGELRQSQGGSADRAILDPKLGEVGRVIFFSQR